MTANQWFAPLLSLSLAMYLAVCDNKWSSVREWMGKRVCLLQNSSYWSHYTLTHLHTCIPIWHSTPQMITSWCCFCCCCFLSFNFNTQQSIQLLASYTHAHARTHTSQVVIMWLCQCFAYYFALWFNEISEEEVKRKEDDFFDDWKSFFPTFQIIIFVNIQRTHAHAHTWIDSCFVFVVYQCTHFSSVVHGQMWDQQSQKVSFLARSLALSTSIQSSIQILTQSLIVSAYSWPFFLLLLGYVFVLFCIHFQPAVYTRVCVCVCLYWLVIFVDSYYFPWLPG